MEMSLGYDAMIGCAEVVSVSASCSRCSILIYASVSSCIMTHLLYRLHTVTSRTTHIYSIEYSLVSLHFTTYTFPLTPSQVFV